MDEKSKFRFDDQLLDFIKFGQNSKAKLMLKKELTRKADSLGTLLHRAAYYDNVEILQYLIDLRSDLNFLEGGRTPLMIAVQNERVKSVKVLLEAGANVDIVDAKGQRAMQMALHSDYFVTQITEAFLYKLQAKISDDNGPSFFELLHCSPRHAITLKHFVLLKFLLIFHPENLRRECDLYTDVQPDLILTFINLELNDYVNDPDGRNFEVIHNKCFDHSLICLPARNERSARISDEIETHLIEEGIMSEKYRYRSGQTVSDLNDASFRRFSSNANALIAHLAVLEKLGTSMVKSSKCYSATWYAGKLTKAEKYHELCPPMLDTVLFETATLFDLLTDHQKLKTYVRNEIFASVIRNACSNHQLRDLFPYYYKTLMICISRAEQVVKLEDAAIIVISKIFKSNYNRCYHFARQVVGYLNKQELERLCLYGQIVGYFNEQDLARWDLIYK